MMSYFRLQSQPPTVTLLSHVLAQGRAECHNTVTLLSHSHDGILPAAIPTPHGYTTVTRIGAGAGGVSHYCHTYMISYFPPRPDGLVTILSHVLAQGRAECYTNVTRVGAGEGGMLH
eukprot:767797-Prorocentrum_minimum.AAC.1